MKKRVTHQSVYILFFIIFGTFYEGSVFSHSGKQMNLFDESLKNLEIAAQNPGIKVASVKSILGQEQFLALVSAGNVQPTVLCVSSGKTSMDLKQICDAQGVAFYELDINKNQWMMSWLAKQLAYEANRFPLYLFFKGNELLLPLCHGKLDQKTLALIIQKKFKLGDLGHEHTKSISVAQPSLFSTCDFSWTTTNRYN